MCANEKDNTVPFSEQDLVDFANALVAKRCSDLPEHDQEDAVQQLCLAAFSCVAHKVEGAPIRTLQWKTLQCEILNFRRAWRNRQCEETILNAPVKGADGPATLADIIPGAPAAAEVAADAEAASAVRQAVASLPERHREFAERRLLHGETLDAIGQSWGVTRQRVRQIEVKVSEALRRKLARFEPACV
jgi:RNA polymerase sigma factor (sigma-70 family)